MTYPEVSSIQANEILTEAFGRPMVVALIQKAIDLGDVEKFLSYIETLEKRPIPKQARDMFNCIFRAAALGWIATDKNLQSASLN